MSSSSSSSCCCCAPCPVGAAARRRGEGARLVLSAAGGDGHGHGDGDALHFNPDQYALSRTAMDVALLREQYKWTKEKQMRQRNRMVIFRRVSEDLSEAVRVVPVTRGPSSLWQPNSNGLPDMTLLPVDPTLMTPDPWHVHLDLHRRINGPADIEVTLTPPPPTSSSNAGSHSPSPRRHSSLSEAGSLKPNYGVERYSVDSAAGLHGSCPNISLTDPLPGYVHGAQARQQQPGGFLQIPPREEGMGSSLASTPGGYSAGSSVNGDSTVGSFMSFDAGSSLTPSSACSSVADPNEIRTFGKVGVQHHPPTLAPGQYLHPNYYPFPNRKFIKKSEAAKKLGMYSNF